MHETELEVIAPGVKVLADGARRDPDCECEPQFRGPAQSALVQQCNVEKRGSVRIYLDACCLNRLTDNQSQVRIGREAEAVEQILRLARGNAIEWVSSDALRTELANNPDAERRNEAEVLLSLATETLSLGGDIVQRAQALEAAGYGAYDALHLSAAESGAADVLLTTDDQFIKRRHGAQAHLAFGFSTR